MARCTVERLMRELGITGAVRGRRVITTLYGGQADRAPDLVDRDFVAGAPNRCWVADFTHVKTWAGVVYVAFVVDIFSRRIVGWYNHRRLHGEIGHVPPVEYETNQQVAKAHPRVKLHVVCDNYATHKTPAVNAWLARHPRITLHFTPTSGSWLNMVEIFFGIITRQAIRRGTFRSVRELTGAIRRFIDAYNERARPFVWTKTADQVLAHARPATPPTR